jgi:hypothetical protein
LADFYSMGRKDLRNLIEDEDFLLRSHFEALGDVYLRLVLSDNSSFHKFKDLISVSSQ